MGMGPELPATHPRPIQIWGLLPSPRFILNLKLFTIRPILKRKLFNRFEREKEEKKKAKQNKIKQKKKKHNNNKTKEKVKTNTKQNNNNGNESR